MGSRSESSTASMKYEEVARLQDRGDEPCPDERQLGVGERGAGFEISAKDVGRESSRADDRSLLRFGATGFREPLEEAGLVPARSRRIVRDALEQTQDHAI